MIAMLIAKFAPWIAGIVGILSAALIWKSKTVAQAKSDSELSALKVDQIQERNENAEALNSFQGNKNEDDNQMRDSDDAIRDRLRKQSRDYIGKP